MNQGSTRRIVASALLAAMATTMAACGIAGGPVAPTGMMNSSIYANQSAGDGTRRFGLRFDASTPKVSTQPSRSHGTTPPAADLRSKLSPVDDQGHVGACSGFAMTGLAEYRARLSGNTAELSPGFVYLMELKEGGNLGKDGGSQISTGMRVLQKYGICTEALHPYLSAADQETPANITAYLSKLPSAAAMKDAAPNRIPGMTAVQSLDGFKAALAAGKPVAFGIAVHQSFMGPTVKATGVVPLPAASEPMLGGHAILAVGYDDAKKQVIFRNSWSPTWGDKGYGYLPYDYFAKNLAGDAWTAN